MTSMKGNRAWVQDILQRATERGEVRPGLSLHDIADA